MLHTIKTNGYHNFTIHNLIRLYGRLNFDIMRIKDAPKTNKTIRQITNRAFEINIVSRLLSVTILYVSATGVFDISILNLLRTSSNILKFLLDMIKQIANPIDYHRFTIECSVHVSINKPVASHRKMHLINSN